MYRGPSATEEQKIERLERDLNVAYQERDAKNESELALALLRLRAQRLAEDIDALRVRQPKEPLWNRLRRQVRRATDRPIALAFVAGLSVGSLALTLGWAAHARLAGLHDAATDDATETTAPNGIEPAITDTTSPEPASVEEPATTAPSASAEPDPAPHGPRTPLSARDHEKLLERSRAFFRAIETKDGPALAALVHPLGLLAMKEEGLMLERNALRRCFTSRRTERVFVTAASDDTVEKTCGDIFAAYVSTPYEDSLDVTFNEEPNAPGLSMPRPATGKVAPFVFFYLPGPGGELLWQGVELTFDRYGDDFVLTAIHKLYWTP